MTQIQTVMSEAFGHRWSSQSDGTKLDVWEQGLTDLTPAQILEGLRATARGQGKEHGWDDVSWPPSLPVFRLMCGVRPPVEQNPLYRQHDAAMHQRERERAARMALPAPDREYQAYRRKQLANRHLAEIRATLQRANPTVPAPRSQPTGDTPPAEPSPAPQPQRLRTPEEMRAYYLGELGLGPADEDVRR